MKNYIITILLLFVATEGFCDSIPCDFRMSDGITLHGTVITPLEKNLKKMVIIVNHRHKTPEGSGPLYTYMIKRLSAQGVSVCYFENRPAMKRDSSFITLFDMADDAVAVYKTLKAIKMFRKYKMGFVGASEEAASALIAASKVPDPAFLIQMVSIIIPQHEKDMQTFTIYAPQLSLGMAGIAGISYHVYSEIVQDIFNYCMTHQKVDKSALEQQLVKQYGGEATKKKKEFPIAMQVLITKVTDPQEGVVPRLHWNSKPYYENVKCPILLLQATDDRNALCYPNIFEFEKIMNENHHNDYNTLLVDATHYLISVSESRKLEHGRSSDVDYSRREQILDLVCKWILMK